MTMDTIYINGRFLTQDITGVQRYAVEMLSALDRIFDTLPDRRVKLVCLTPDVELNIQTAWKNIAIQKCGPFSGNLWEQVTLPINSRNGTLFSPCNIGPFFKRKQIITIHDASFLFRLKYKLNYQILGRTIPRIITVSEFSNKELIHYCGFQPEKIKVIHNGCDHQVQRVEPVPFARLDLPEKYILAVGSLSKHKNIQAVIQSVDQLDQDIHVVVAGSAYSKVFSGMALAENPRVHLLGYVSESDLVALYRNAIAFVFPSRYEGFGIPALEAMRNHCPVIASNRASLPEVCGDAALYFDPDSVRQIADCVNTLNSCTELRATLIAKGEARAAQFTWDQCARETWKVLGSVI